jgi:hypothetical protein
VDRNVPLTRLAERLSAALRNVRGPPQGGAQDFVAAGQAGCPRSGFDHAKALRGPAGSLRPNPLRRVPLV